MKYFAHYEENAVIRENNNGECFAKLWIPKSINAGNVTPEYKLGNNSEIRFGNHDYMSLPYEITKIEYNTFGVKWIFGDSPDNNLIRI